MGAFSQGAMIERVQSTATAAGTTTLTSSSRTVQEFTGTSTQTVKLPDATTMKNGRYFDICNRSTNTVTVNYQDNTLAKTITADFQRRFILMDNSTSNGTWDISTDGPSTVTSIPTSSQDLENLGLSVSVASNALTVAIKQSDGTTDPAAGTGAVLIGFRNSTVTSGAYAQRSLTSAHSFTVPSGATLGAGNGLQHYYYIYAIDNSGTIEGGISMTAFQEGGVITTVALGTGSDLNNVVYTTTARTSVPFRIVGRLSATEATAGTWATTPSEVCVWPFTIGGIFAHYYSTTTASIPSGATVIDYDTRVFDTHNAKSGTGTGWIWTAPRDDDYVIRAQYLTGNTTTEGRYNIFLLKNGSTTEASIVYSSPATTNLHRVTPQFTTILRLSKNDTLAVQGNESLSSGNVYAGGASGDMSVNISNMGPKI